MCELFVTVYVQLLSTGRRCWASKYSSQKDLNWLNLHFQLRERPVFNLPFPSISILGYFCLFVHPFIFLSAAPVFKRLRLPVWLPFSGPGRWKVKETEAVFKDVSCKLGHDLHWWIAKWAFDRQKKRPFILCATWANVRKSQGFLLLT